MRIVAGYKEFKAMKVRSRLTFVLAFVLCVSLLPINTACALQANEVITTTVQNVTEASSRANDGSTGQISQSISSGKSSTSNTSKSVSSSNAIPLEKGASTLILLSISVIVLFAAAMMLRLRNKKK